MISTGLMLTLEKQSIDELFSIIGERSGDLDRTGFVQGTQKVSRTRRTLVLFDLQKHPSRRSVNRRKLVAPRDLVSHICNEYLMSMCTKPGTTPLKDS